MLYFVLSICIWAILRDYNLLSLPSPDGCASRVPCQVSWMHNPEEAAEKLARNPQHFDQRSFITAHRHADGSSSVQHGFPINAMIQRADLEAAQEACPLLAILLFSFPYFWLFKFEISVSNRYAIDPGGPPLASAVQWQPACTAPSGLWLARSFHGQWGWTFLFGAMLLFKVPDHCRSLALYT